VYSRDFLALVITAVSRVLTRILFMVFFLSAVKSLLLCLKNKKQTLSLKEKC